MWFSEIHDLEYPSEYTASDLAFLRGLRQAIADWPHNPADSWAWHVFGDPPLVAAVTLTDHESRVGLGDFGVHVFAPGIVRADLLHNQLYHLPEQPTRLGADITGTPEQVVAKCAAWFEQIITAPIERLEWWHRGHRYAQRWKFSVIEYALVQQYDRRYAPPGQAERLAAGGHVHGKGWTQTSGLGKPDRVIRVRN